MSDALPRRGQTFTVTCAGCPTTITYVLRGRHQIYCAECKAARALRASQRYYVMSSKRANLAAGELAAYDPKGIAGVAAMTQEEAAARLAVWESLDHKIKTGRFKFIRPLTPQRIQQIERDALAKLRRALRADYQEIKEEISTRSQTCVVRHFPSLMEGELFVDKLHLHGMEVGSKVADECKNPSLTEASPPSPNSQYEGASKG